MAAQETCTFCNKLIVSDRSTVTKKGLDTILKISADLQDGIDKRLVQEKVPIPAHKSCKTDYTRPSNIRKRKRMTMEVDDDDGEDTKHVRRSQVPALNIKTECIYCGKYMDYAKHTKQPINQHDRMHEVETPELLSSIIAKALERGDAWGQAVFICVQNIGDLMAAEAKYHHQCQVRFHDGRSLEKKAKRSPIRVC